jgi:hypothetical protein
VCRAIDVRKEPGASFEILIPDVRPDKRLIDAEKNQISLSSEKEIGNRDHLPGC